MSDRVNQNVDKFFKYMSKPMLLSNIEMLYSSNNVVFERVDLYRDFVLTLNDLIISTYLGDELTNKLEQINHFNWCWNRTSELLSLRNIQFNENKIAHTYFTNFYFDNFYFIDKNDEMVKINEIGGVWKYIFDYNIEKTRSDLDTFIALYKIFEKSYKKR